MKVIGIISAILAIVVGIGFGIFKLMYAYEKAKQYLELSTKERIFMYLIDRKLYMNFKENYYFVRSLPFIGSRL